MSLENLCANCGVQVTGRFCSNCGQRVESPVHSLWHFVAEATEDLAHADSRLWRTVLALLFKPGFLTREFLSGRRARYLPPLRLYLVLSVVFFLFANLRGPTVYLIGFQPGDNGSNRLVATPMVPERTPTGETRDQLRDRACGQTLYNGPFRSTIEPAFRRACRQAFEDKGRALQETILHAIPRGLFVFLPLLALVMMALYWHPRHFYVEHLLLFIHNHAFIFLALTVFGLLQKVLPRSVGDLLAAPTLLLYITWYVFKSMRRVYGQGRWLTAAKLGVMSIAYLVSALAMAIATTLYAVVAM